MIAMQRSGNGIRGDRCNESPRGEVCLSTETEAHEVVLLPGSGTYKTRSGPGSPTSHSALPAPPVSLALAGTAPRLPWEKVPGFAVPAIGRSSSSV